MTTSVKMFFCIQSVISRRAVSLIYFGLRDEDAQEIEREEVTCSVLQGKYKEVANSFWFVGCSLAKHTDLQPLAQRAFKTYVKSIFKQKDKQVFVVTKLPTNDHSTSLGLPMTPQLCYLDRKNINKKLSESPGTPVLFPKFPCKNI